MNSTTSGNNLYTYHTFANVEFSGVLDKYNVYMYTYTAFVRSTYDYHLFIRYGEKVYMDVNGIGDIVISYEELQKNKYWKHYYDISLLLTNNKHFVAEDLEYNSHYHDPYIYEEKRVWAINTAYIDGGYDDKTKMVVANEYNCYYKINPYDLADMKYSSQKDLNIYKKIYMSRYEIITNIFEKKNIYYYNLVIDYCVSYMEKELEELSVIFEDKKNVINLATLNDKEGMNGDILMIIYNNIVSLEENKRYYHLMTELGTCNRLESIARIMAT